MPKPKREDRGKVARGGAPRRKCPSRAASYLHQQNLDQGRVLDFGCGFGLDADTFGWHGYDPYYRPHLPPGTFDTIVSINVLSAVSEANQEKILEDMQALLAPDGYIYVAAPRNLPKGGKLSGFHRRPQRNVILKKAQSIHLVPQKYEIYKLGKVSE